MGFFWASKVLIEAGLIKGLASENGVFLEAGLL
jgi:hypothetical protein